MKSAAPPRHVPIELPVDIEKPIYGGSFLARVDGKATFVPFVLSGERARIHIVDQKRGYSEAEADEILVPAPERAAASCRHFGVCGGCQYQHATYDAQLAYKLAILRETLLRGGVAPPTEIAMLAAEPWAYRNRIRLAFDRDGRPGYRSRRSHAIVAVEECPIAAPLLVKAATASGEILRQRRSPIHAKEIALFCDSEQKALLLTLVAAGGSQSGLSEFADALNERIPELIGAEIVNEGNGIEAPRRAAQWGVDSLLYSAAGSQYRVDHGAFFQVNRWLVDALVTGVTSRESGRIAWDLFAGVGLFARQLASNFERVVAVESAPSAISALEENLSGMSAKAVKASTLDFLRKSASAQEKPNLIVVDPPRTGLGTETTTLLAAIGAPRLTYVSCDPATLTRDLKALIGSGYAIESMTLADLFPQTFHVETVVQLRHQG